ncbi:MAG: substrate-binding domain-containing protein [Planctomycetota bacterium]|nr:substrate-binding domain-containing protein [Planctomycetota bacterium]
MLRMVALLLVVPCALAACGDAPDAGARVRLATTTSTENSGLLRAILPAFEAESGLRVDVIAVGTGQALALGERGEADLVLVHARPLEDAFVAAGHGVERRDVMWNDFVIAGPPADPAGVRGLRDGAAALTRLAAAGATFVARGDGSGTDVREQALWRAGGGRPSWAGYLVAGQGMGPCLTIADEKRAYVLTDRGTLLAYRARLELQVLVEGDEDLRNPYGAILVNPARHAHVNAEGARALLAWLTSPAGQAAIAAFRVGEHVLFHPHVGG